MTDTKKHYYIPDHKRRLMQAVLNGELIELHGGATNRVIRDTDEAFEIISESSLNYLEVHVRIKPDTVRINEKEVPKPAAVHLFAPEEDLRTLSIWGNGELYCTLEYKGTDDVLVVASAITQVLKGE